MRKLLYVLSFFFLVGSLSCQVYAKKKKSTDLLSALKKDSVNGDYKRITKDAVIQKGVFTVIYNEKEGKLYFEIPDSAFKETYMLANRIASISDTRDYVAGQTVSAPLLINFTKDARNVYMNQIQSNDVVAKNDPIESSYRNNFLNPILKGFKIAAHNGDHVVIDVTTFFGANEACISPMKDSGPLSKLLGNSNSIKGTFVSDASGINEVKAFAKNIEIMSTLSYNTTGVITKPYSVKMHRSFFVLPDDMMPMRYQDNKVGFFYNDKSIFSSNDDRIQQRTFINRWRIQPKPEDKEKYFKGELVEPMKPIVFYVDTAFPEKWRKTIKEGIEEWNIAFKAAGFKHVVKAVDYPANDPNFNPDDMRYNCFKYALTPTANAMGPSYIDPRTGEILSADVIWYHNIISLLHNWRFVQTGAVDKRVRKQVFDDDVMCESMRYAASHEVGHTLGLMHNMGASYAFPVDSLRDPAFTQEYGTTPSIMDYARNNYVAQPGDLERGVKLTPPLIGVYDIYAINWGYRIIPDTKTPEDEKPVLDRWIAEKQKDPKYQFGAQQVFSTIDPTDQTEDLGNDHIKAGNLAISNLKILMKNLSTWTMEKGERYDHLETTYREVVKQYNRYIKHVMPYIGGIVYEEVRQGDDKPTAKHYINKLQQKRAMYWLLDQARTYDSWLTPSSLISKLEVDMNVNDGIRRNVMLSLLNGATLYRIKEGGELNSMTNYTIDSYLTDLMNATFKAPVGGKLTPAEQDLQNSAITIMTKNSGLEKKATTPSSSSESLIDEYDKYCFDLDAPSLPCDYDACANTSFVRINLGVSALTQAELGALMTGRLQRVLNMYRAYKNSAVGSTRDFYNYQILLIEKLLSTK